MRRLLYIVPAVLFVVMAGFLGWGLTNDPSEVPTALAGREVPAFVLPALDGSPGGLADSDVAHGAVTVINVFASWCVPCRAEHPQLTDIAAMDGVTLYGIAYKDKPEDTRAFLEELGDPFARIGVDLDGRVGIDLGVYGVPETFVIGPDRAIRYKHIGPITPDHVETRIRPLIDTLRAP